MPEVITDAIVAPAAIYFFREFNLPGWDITGWSQILFSLKSDLNDTDRQSLLVVRLSNPVVAGDGVKYHSGLPIADADALHGQAAIGVVTVSPDAKLTLEATEVAMDLRPTPSDEIYWWELDVWSSGKRQIGRGEFTLTQGVWRGLTVP